MFTSNYFGLYAINIITSNRPTCCCNYHQKYTWDEFVLKVYTIYLFNRFIQSIPFNYIENW